MKNIKDLWKKVSPYRHTMRLFDWLGPRGSILLLCGAIWIQTGIGTAQGFSGVPTDAPHLLVPSLLRGTLWILFGLLAVILSPTRSVKWHKIAITGLSVMPVIRLCSYLLSWVVSWSVFQAIFPHFPLQGSPRAEYSSTFWQADILLVVILMLAPATWKMVSGYLINEEQGNYDRTVRVVNSEDSNTSVSPQARDGEENQ